MIEKYLPALYKGLMKIEKTIKTKREKGSSDLHIASRKVFL